MTVETMTPREIVNELDRFIVGQNDAKRAVAIALRNRWRRMQLGEDMRHEITPKNILMIGPTGVGKTEIARRLAALAKAPFIKVEATKFTEIGYVGRDVESIIRDLVDRAVKMTREQETEKVKEHAHEAAEERILNALLPKVKENFSEKLGETTEEKPASKEEESATRKLFRKKLKEGELDDKEIEIELAQGGVVGMEIMGPPGMEEMVGQLQHLMQSVTDKHKKPKRLKVKVAMKQLVEEEAAKMVNEENIRTKALENVEQNGIVFIDEMDKIVRTDKSHGADVSREGVQRDLLPLVEGCTVTTKYGMIKTDHILFIASGAFHLSKPSDLIPELQGRFPIRVELNALSTEDLVRILTEPKASLTEQYTELLKTEGITLKWTKQGIQRIAEIAYQVNNTAENIGARRLHTVLEKLLDKISFDASDMPENTISITAKYVDEQLKKIATDQDLSQYIL